VAAGSLEQATKTRQLNAEDTDSVEEADKTEMAIISARQRGDKTGLILALEVKMTEMVSQICYQFCPCWKLK
jgi:hypothetical protein